MLSKGWGTLRADSGRPVGPRTVFEAASLGKTVFALAVMTLVEEGRLDLDAPVGRYMPNVPPRLAELTARELLSHSSGLPNHPADGASLVPAFEPGTAWSYSGYGYNLLQAVVESLTKRPFESFVRSRVFEPLGMDESSYVWRPAYDSLAAVGHDSTGRPRPVWKPDSADATVASSLHTSARDLARFLVAMLAEGRSGSPLADSVAQSMLRPQVAVDSCLAMSWGLGWALERSGDSTFFFHCGADPYFRSFEMGSRQSGRAFVLLTNGKEGLEMAGEVARIATGRRHPIFRFYMLHPTD